MIPRNVQITVVLLLLAVACMGIYTVRLRRRTESHIQKAAAPVPVQPRGDEKRVTLILASDRDGKLEPSSVGAKLPSEETERARALLQLLIRTYQQPSSTHPLDAGGTIDSVFLLKGGIAVVDLSDSFAKTHPSGIMLESLTLESIAATLHANLSQVERVHFLVGGSSRETLAGHADLTTDYPVLPANQ